MQHYKNGPCGAPWEVENMKEFKITYYVGDEESGYMYSEIFKGMNMMDALRRFEHDCKYDNPEIITQVVSCEII